MFVLSVVAGRPADRPHRFEEHIMSEAQNWQFETKQIHAGAAPDPVTK